jgi:WD40 repeat protein
VTNSRAANRVLDLLLAEIGGPRGHGWDAAPEYTLRHAIEHALDADRADELLADPLFLANADPEPLLRVLARAGSGDAKLATAVYVASLAQHRRLPAASRRNLLAVDAARLGAPQLVDALCEGLLPGSWRPRWATGSQVSNGLYEEVSLRRGEISGAVCVNAIDERAAVVAFGGSKVSIWSRNSRGEATIREFISGVSEVSAIASTYADPVLYIVTGHADGSVQMWKLALESLPELSNASHVTLQPQWNIVGHVGTVTVAACTTVNNCPVVVTAGGIGDNAVRVWNLATGEPRPAIVTNHEGGISGLACNMTDGGRAVAVTTGGIGDCFARVWDLGTGAIETVINIGPDTVTALTSSPDGHFLFTGHWDGEVKMWDLQAGHQTHGWHGSSSRSQRDLIVETRAPVSSIAYTYVQSHPVVLIGHENGMANVRSVVQEYVVGEVIARHPAGIVAMDSTTMDGRPVAMTAGSMGDTTLRFWDLGLAHQQGAPRVGHGAEVIGTAVLETPDRGRIVVSVSSDATVHIVPLSTGLDDQQVYSATGGEISDIAFGCLNNRPVAVLNATGDLRLLDLISGQEIYEVSALTLASNVEPWNAVKAVACMTIEGRPAIVTTGSTRSLSLWDMATGCLLQRWTTKRRKMHLGTLACCMLDGVPTAVSDMYVWDLLTGGSRRLSLREDMNSEEVTAVACSNRDGEPLAVIGFDHGKVGLWRLRDGSCLGSLEGHSDTITSISCTTLGERPVAITGSRDCTVRVWDLRDAQAIDVLNMPEPVTALAVDSGGILVIGSGFEVIVMEQQGGI